MTDDNVSVVGLAERVTRLETDLCWIKSKLECIERRQWETLVGVIVFGVISIVIALIRFV
ncbi:MAG: hypothetical protein QXH20_00435 [Candidatus Bathyarchaeia archaeon]